MTFGKELIQSIKEAMAIAEDRANPAAIFVSETIDVATIRKAKNFHRKGVQSSMIYLLVPSKIESESFINLIVQHKGYSISTRHCSAGNSRISVNRKLLGY